MKKTLLGVLAFVLVVVTLLTGTVLAADDTTSDVNNVAEVKMVDANHPIIVDGEMDEAYTSATPLLIATRPSGEVNGLYTHGYARFVWSKAENALYCHIIMNDAEVGPCNKQPWVGDSAEIYIDFTGTGTQNWGLADTQVTGGGALSRGLQYRIDGFKGFPTCYLVEDLNTSGGANNPSNLKGEAGNMYWFDEDLGRLTNYGANNLINENTNLFGWKYSADKTKTGWGHKTTSYGYMVEFRVDGDGTGATLADGMKVLFDVQINDRYGLNPDGSGNQTNVYYSSTYRQANASAGNTMQYYDSITLVEEVVDNTYSSIAEAQLAKYGLADASLEFTIPTKPTERTYTSKVTIDRLFTQRSGVTTKKTTTGGVVTTGGGTGNNDGGNTTTDPSTSGGCGGSVAIGTSVAMLALVGATGFFAFRKKDEE